MRRWEILVVGHGGPGVLGLEVKMGRPFVGTSHLKIEAVTGLNFKWNLGIQRTSCVKFCSAFDICPVMQTLKRVASTCAVASSFKFSPKPE
jgi:hypothetical protein